MSHVPRWSSYRRRYSSFDKLANAEPAVLRAVLATVNDDLLAASEREAGGQVCDHSRLDSVGRQCGQSQSATSHAGTGGGAASVAVVALGVQQLGPGTLRK
jgi:hypothetical protein